MKKNPWKSVRSASLRVLFFGIQTSPFPDSSYHWPRIAKRTPIPPDRALQRKEGNVRHLLRFTAAGLLAGLFVYNCTASQLTGKAGAKKTPAKDAAECVDGECGTYGTTVTFVNSPSEAARQA